MEVGFGTYVNTFGGEERGPGDGIIEVVMGEFLVFAAGLEDECFAMVVGDEEVIAGDAGTWIDVGGGYSGVATHIADRKRLGVNELALVIGI